MKVKICGMKVPSNIQDIARLSPDYLGFIFYSKSPRYFEGHLPVLPENIKKVGVFVNATASEISSRVQQYGLQAVQLHASEQPQLCEQLQEQGLEVIKVFSVGDSFDFGDLKPYEEVVDYFLFDTRGKAPGGNGITFNWEVMKAYPSKIPFFLSGGIGLSQAGAVRALYRTFQQADQGQLFAGIDLNSRFESAPGVKQQDELEDFLNQLELFKDQSCHSKPQKNEN